jgi:hypothetical protein
MQGMRRSVVVATIGEGNEDPAHEATESPEREAQEHAATGSSTMPTPAPEAPAVDSGQA